MRHGFDKYIWFAFNILIKNCGRGGLDKILGLSSYRSQTAKNPAQRSFGRRNLESRWVGVGYGKPQ